MKHYIKTVTWKFKDASTTYPELTNSKIKITSPADVFKHFRFYLMEK